MLRNALSSVATDEQSLDSTLEHALLQEAPDLAGNVLGEYRAEKEAGHAEQARELLASAVQVVRTIQQIDGSTQL
jgi:hypothetical protein